MPRSPVISRDSDWVRDEIWVSDINGDVVNDAIFLRSIHQQLRTAVTSENNTIASMFKAQAKVIDKLLTKLNDGLLAIQ